MRSDIIPVGQRDATPRPGRNHNPGGQYSSHDRPNMCGHHQEGSTTWARSLPPMARKPFYKDWETVSGYLNRTETGNNG